MTNDVFCDRKKIEKDILAETGNWIVKLGFGITTPGHVMLIPKQHFACFADIPDKLLCEFEEVLHPLLKSYINERFSMPFGVEYGIFGQTVPHAHLHYIPSRGEGYHVESVINDILLKANVPFERGDRHLLKDIRKKTGRYNLFIEDREYLICPIPKKISEEYAKVLDTVLNYRVFLKLMGGKVPLKLGSRTSEEIDRDDIWREETRGKFRDLSKLLH